MDMLNIIENMQNGIINQYKIALFDGNTGKLLNQKLHTYPHESPISEKYLDVTPYLKIVEQLSKIEQEFQNEKDAIEELNCSSIDGFDEKARSVLAEVRSNIVISQIQSQRYKKFVSDVENIIETKNNQTNNKVTTDEVQADEFIVSIDPITKMPITEPVRNIRCNHIYDKVSIMKCIGNGIK